MIFFKISSASLCLSDTKITKVFFRLLGGRHSQYLWYFLKMLTDKKILNCFSHTFLVNKTLFLVTLFSQWDFYLNLLLTRKSSHKSFCQQGILCLFPCKFWHGLGFSLIVFLISFFYYYYLGKLLTLHRNVITTCGQYKSDTKD